jgi:hypothetical protein
LYSLPSYLVPDPPSLLDSLLPFCLFVLLSSLENKNLLCRLLCGFAAHDSRKVLMAAFEKMEVFRNMSVFSSWFFARSCPVSQNWGGQPCFKFHTEHYATKTYRMVPRNKPFLCCTLLLTPHKAVK